MILCHNYKRHWTVSTKGIETYLWTTLCQLRNRLKHTYKRYYAIFMIDIMSYITYSFLWLILFQTYLIWHIRRIPFNEIKHNWYGKTIYQPAQRIPFVIVNTPNCLWNKHMVWLILLYESISNHGNFCLLYFHAKKILFGIFIP